MTKVLITDDGSVFPLVVNSGETDYAVGSDWDYETGANYVSNFVDHVAIIVDQEPLNPDLIPWLMVFGASFDGLGSNTFSQLPLYSEDLGYFNHDIASVGCFNYRGNGYLTIFADDNVQIQTPRLESDYVLSCDYDPVIWNESLYAFIFCNIDALNDFDNPDANRIELMRFYYNAVVCKALGVPEEYLR